MFASRKYAAIQAGRVSGIKSEGTTAQVPGRLQALSGGPGKPVSQLMIRFFQRLPFKFCPVETRFCGGHRRCFFTKLSVCRITMIFEVTSLLCRSIRPLKKSPTKRRRLTARAMAGWIVRRRRLRPMGWRGELFFHHPRRHPEPLTEPLGKISQAAEAHHERHLRGVARALFK